MVKRFILLLLLYMPFVCEAEYRLWLVNEKEIEAEFVELKGKRVVVRLLDGKPFALDADTLSEADKLYVKGRLPPELDISVTKHVVEAKEPADEPKIYLQLELKQKGAPPHPGRFEVEFVVIGKDKRRGGMLIIGSGKEMFSLEELNGASFVMKTDPFSEKDLDEIKGASGKEEYDGYVVLVTNQYGDRVATVCSQMQYENRIDKLLNQVDEVMKEERKRRRMDLY
jgi:hypothetical protein